MDDIRSLKALQLDALREVANIGAGHAATALSQMIGGTIMISVPTINVSRLEEVPPQISAPEEPVAAVLMHMLGDLTGRTLLVFPKPTAVRLAELMLRRPAGSATELGEDRKSTRLNSSHTVIYTLSLHDALPIWRPHGADAARIPEAHRRAFGRADAPPAGRLRDGARRRSEEHTSELQSHSDLHSFPTRRSSDLATSRGGRCSYSRSPPPCVWQS